MKKDCGSFPKARPTDRLQDTRP